MNWAICYIGFGSNLGNRSDHCCQALHALRKLPRTRLNAVSSFYETEPVCAKGPWFLNGVAELSTSLSPNELLEGCQRIETRLGRQRPDLPGAPRTIDLDILLMDEQILDLPGLKVPHPRMHERGFVLLPLVEIAPKALHPVFRKNISEILLGLKDPHEVRRAGPAPSLFAHCRS